MNDDDRWLVRIVGLHCVEPFEVRLLTSRTSSQNQGRGDSQNDIQRALGHLLTVADSAAMKKGWARRACQEPAASAIL